MLGVCANDLYSFYRAMLCMARTTMSQDVFLSVRLSARLSHVRIVS